VVQMVPVSSLATALLIISLAVSQYDYELRDTGSEGLILYRV
jgi:hypothetical protein